ncbi:hypothetical protein L9F63_019670, partial [Diploptera punctata]
FIMRLWIVFYGIFTNLCVRLLSSFFLQVTIKKIIYLLIFITNVMIRCRYFSFSDIMFRASMDNWCLIYLMRNYLNVLLVRSHFLQGHILIDIYFSISYLNTHLLSSLKTHLLVHSNEKLFKCSLLMRNYSSVLFVISHSLHILKKIVFIGLMGLVVILYVLFIPLILSSSFV